MRAKLAGRCAHCDSPIEPGELIEKIRAGWAHKDCPADPPDDMPGFHYDGDY